MGFGIEDTLVQC